MNNGPMIPCPYCAGTGNPTPGNDLPGGRETCIKCGGTGMIDPGTGMSRSASADPLTGRAYGSGSTSAGEEDWCAVMRDARQWILKKTAQVRGLSVEAAAPGEAMLVRIDNVLASAPTADTSVPATPVGGEEDVRSTLERFRKFVISNATQWKRGSNHHNPIWEEVVEAILRVPATPVPSNAEGNLTRDVDVARARLTELFERCTLEAARKPGSPTSEIAGWYVGQALALFPARRLSAEDDLARTLLSEAVELEAEAFDHPPYSLDSARKKDAAEVLRDVAARLARTTPTSAGKVDGVENALSERIAICAELGCVDGPGVPLRFVRDLRQHLGKAHARIAELIRSWDPATPTERQELDRLRRGWGPSSPTERERRRQDVTACLSALSVAMADLAVSDDEDVPDPARDRLDEAYERISKQYRAVIALSHALHADPQEWPDIKAAEERGAAKALAALTPSPSEGKEEAIPAGWDLEPVVKSLAGMLDTFGGYQCPEVDAAITAMQGACIDRWSMQAQMEARAVPAGWVLVPVEPTEEQKEAGREVFDQGGYLRYRTPDVYRAMLAAAPQPPTPRSGGEGQGAPSLVGADRELADAISLIEDRIRIYGRYDEPTEAALWALYELVATSRATLPALDQETGQ